MRIGDRLGDTGPAPGEADARRRAWALAEAAAAAGQAGRRGGPRRWRSAAAALLTLLVAALALTAPGDAVAEWLRDRVRTVVDPAPVPVRMDRLPGGGRLLLSSPAGPVVVGATAPDGLLGRVDEATFSPRGRYVAAARGGELIAVDRRGRRRWSLSRPVRVGGVRWSPSGFRVAYLSGSELRVVAGDGTGDRRVARSAGPAPAWRPRGARRGLHELALTDLSGRVLLVDVDRRRVLWRSRQRVAGARQLGPRQLEWSADGSRLLAISRTRSLVLNAAGALIRRGNAPPGRTNDTVAFARTGRDYAITRRTLDGRTEVVLVRGGREVGAGRDQFLLAFPGRAFGLKWSPDGRWLALAAPGADVVQLLRPGRRGLDATRSLEGAARRFGDGRFVRLEGWCC